MDITKTEITIAELHTITLTNGDIGYFTDFDKDISYGGHTYKHLPIKRSDINKYTNLQIDSMNVSIGTVGVTLGGSSLSIPKVIARRLFNNAHYKLESFDTVAADTPTELFQGYIAKAVPFSEMELVFIVSSPLDKYNVMFPNKFYSERCNHLLYDNRCGIDNTLSKWKHTGSIDIYTPVSNRLRIYSTLFDHNGQVTPNPDDSDYKGFFELGSIKFTSGDNDGVEETIINHGDTYVDLIRPLPSDPQEDDTFITWAGCDFSGWICEKKFDNYANSLMFEGLGSSLSLRGKNEDE